ncbi:MAG: hypothetical protein RSF87_12370, partial [Cellulosilyticaceae bacterium]
AKAKIQHLTWSLKNNYLGLKNQATWEIYVKQSRSLISKIPKTESNIAKLLTDEVNRDAGFILALARINHVEKSMTPKEQGGYGNALIPKNVPQWREYIRLANIDLEKVNKKEFKAQYDELIKRRDVVNKKLDSIMSGQTSEYVIKDYKSSVGYNIRRMYSLTDFSNAALMAKEFKRISESGELGFSNNKQNVDTVILIDKADIMSGALSGALINKYNAPIMYLEGDKIHSATKKELVASSFKNAILVSSKSNSFINVQSELKSMNINILAKFIEKDMYDLSFAIANSIEKISQVNVVDGDTNTYFDRVVALAPLSAYGEVTVLLPTKGIKSEDINKFKNYEEWITKLNREQKTGHQTYDKSLEKVTCEKDWGGYSNVVGGFTDITGGNYKVNISINNAEYLDLRDTRLVMAHGNKQSDILSIMPLAVKIRTSLLYGGDIPSVTMPDAEARRISLKERYNGSVNATRKIYMIGNETIMKNGVEKKLLGEDY